MVAIAEQRPREFDAADRTHGRAADYCKRQDRYRSRKEKAL
jgi:hypothetical protein